MRYELFLRSSTPLSDEQLQAMAEAVEGSSAVEMEPYVSEEETLGVDLAVDVDDPRGGPALCEMAFSLADEYRLSVFDPQISRTVTQGEEAEIRRQVDQVSTFSQAALVSPVGATTPSSGPSTLWIWLVLIGSIVLLYLVSKMLTCSVGSGLKLT